MRSHWTEAKLFKFLRLYKRYECLWNPYSLEYGSCDAKSEAFSQILYEMNIFGLTVGECLNQIKYIRETYKQEQQRLESLAYLGGRGYSNVLWYPLMHSMLSKVIRDEEKLNQEAGNLDSVVESKRSAFHCGDQWNQRESNIMTYEQRIFSWDHGETTTICPYLLNSNYRNNTNCYFNPNILNNCNGMCAAPNEHISSCPTCGYSSGSCCDCFSMNNDGYNRNTFGENYNNQSPINYRPRTSYNYRNGILEINSAVRIPVSQSSPNYGYRHLIENITPEEPEYNFDEISSNLHRPDVQNITEAEDFPITCCAKSVNYKNKQDKISNETNTLEIVTHRANNYSGPPKLPINKNGVTTKNINWRFENQKNDIQSSEVESAKLFDTEQKILMPDSQEQIETDIISEKASNSDMNMTEVNTKVEQASGIAVKNKQPMKEDIFSQAKLKSMNKDLEITAKFGESKNFQTKLTSLRSEPTQKTSLLNQQTGLGVTNEFNKEISDVETTEDLVRQSKGIIKHNLTKIVIDFIDETLNRSGNITTVDVGERLILKKMAKDLQTLRNENNCVCNDNLAIKDYQQSEQNGSLKYRNKTICWREPIEERLNIVPCRSTRSQANKTNYTKSILARRSIQLNKDTANCFRLMGGADFDVDNDLKQSNRLNRKDTRSRTKEITTDEHYSFTKNRKTWHGIPVSSNSKKHFLIESDRTQRQSYEKNDRNISNTLNPMAIQTNSEGESGQPIDQIALNHLNSEVLISHENLKLFDENKMKNNGFSVIIDEPHQTKESIDLNLQNIGIDEQLITIQRNLIAKDSEDQVDNLECCSPLNSTSHDIIEEENGITMNISVTTSKSTENKIIDGVVNKITAILQKTLDKNGYMIEEKQFFTKKNLITNDNGEISQKIIGNEAVWTTELRNIIGTLMKHERLRDSITFKVKTMILPVTNQVNVTGEGGKNSISSLKTRKKHMRSKGGLTKIHRTFDNSNRKNSIAQYGSRRNINEVLFNDRGEVPAESRDECERIIENSESKLTLMNPTAHQNDSISILEREGHYKMPFRKLFHKTKRRTCDEQFKGLDSDILLYKLNRDCRFDEKMLTNHIKKSIKRKRRIIHRYASGNLTHLDKIAINDVNRIGLPYNDHPYVLRKLLRYLVKLRKEFQSIPKKFEKSISCNQSQKNKYAIMNDRKLQHNPTDGLYQKHECGTASYYNKLPCNLIKNIDVYLCTEVSQEDPTPMQKKSCDYCSDSSISRDVNKNLLSTSSAIREISQTKYMRKSCEQETIRRSEQDFSEWESFSDSDEEAEIVKHCQHQNTICRQDSKIQLEKNTSTEKFGVTRNLNQRNGYFSHNNSVAVISGESYPAIYRPTIKNTFGYRKHVKKVDKLDNTPTNKEYFVSSKANGLKNTTSLQNNCTVVDIFSSNNQNISQQELRSSEEGSETSLCCAETFEDTQGANKFRFPFRSESKDAQSLLETKLGIAADSHAKSCWTRDKTTSVCTPICDVTSRLSDISSKNTCCCDNLAKLKNADQVFLSSRIEPGKKNVRIGDEILRSISASCQTESIKKNLNLLERQSHMSQNCRENVDSSFQVPGDETYAKNSAAPDKNIIKKNDGIILLNNIDHSKPVATIKEVTVESNTRNVVPISLDVSALERESFLIEIKMLQPLFSIELKKGHKSQERSGLVDKQNSCEFFKQNKRDVGITLKQESVIKSSNKNYAMSPQQQSIYYINETTSTSSVNDGIQRIIDQGLQVLSQKKAEEILSCRTQINQICEIGSDSNNKIKVTTEESSSSNSVNSSLPENNASTSFEGNLNSSNPGQCHISLDTFRSLKNYQNSCETGINDLPANRSISCAEKAISSDETESLTIQTLISTMETSLQYITDPIIYKKLFDMIMHIRDRDQNQNYSMEKILHQGEVRESLRNVESQVSRNEIETQVACGVDIRPRSLLLITKDSECQKPCESLALLTTNSSRNTEGMLDNVQILHDGNESAHSKLTSLIGHILTDGEETNQISANESQVMLSKAEKLCCQSTTHPTLEHKTSKPDGALADEIEAIKKTRSKSPHLAFVSKSEILKVGEPINIFYKNHVISDDEQSELQQNSCLMSTLNYSSNEISCAVEEVESDGSSYDHSINEQINATPQLQNYENYNSSEYYCCRRESIDIDINAFTNTVASQLRQLSTEAALRSQQRIQTLISNSRLESEKNRKGR